MIEGVGQQSENRILVEFGFVIVILVSPFYSPKSKDQALYSQSISNTLGWQIYWASILLPFLAGYGPSAYSMLFPVNSVAIMIAFSFL